MSRVRSTASSRATIAAIAVAAIPLGVGFASLAALWPGILSDDSVDQWTQLLTLALTPYHSPVHTLTYWLITRLWLSPAAVAIVQTLAIAAVCGAIARATVAAGASLWLALLTAAALFLTPSIGIMAITLWKDVPYAICLLWLVSVLWTLAVAPPEARDRWPTLAGLAVSLAGVSLYRHNGLPVAGLVAAWLLVGVGRSRRLRLGAALGAAAALIAGGLVVVPRALGIGPIHASLTHQAPIHQMAAMVAAGVELPPDDQALITSMSPPEGLAPWYDCGNVMPTLMHMKGPPFVAQVRTFEAAWIRALLAHPGVALRHLGCVSGFIWNPAQVPHAYVAMGIVPNRVGLETVPRSMRLNGIYWSVFLTTTTQPVLRTLLWGPPLHLAIVLVCAGVAWRRVGRRGLWPFLPPIVHTLVLIPLIPSTEYRLQFPVVLIALLSPLLTAGLIAAARRQESATSAA